MRNSVCVDLIKCADQRVERPEHHELVASQEPPNIERAVSVYRFKEAICFQFARYNTSYGAGFIFASSYVRTCWNVVAIATVLAESEWSLRTVNAVRFAGILPRRVGDSLISIGEHDFDMLIMCRDLYYAKQVSKPGLGFWSKCTGRDEVSLKYQ